MTGSRWLAGLSVVGALMAAPAFGEQAIPVGPEFQVSRGKHRLGYLDGYAYNFDVSRAPSGDSVVGWEEHVQAYQG